VVLSLTLRGMVRSVDNGVYNRMGGSWWDETSPLNVLHGSVTPGRFAYFRDVLAPQLVPGLPECGCWTSAAAAGSWPRSSRPSAAG
jgi:hypothetical protein